MKRVLQLLSVLLLFVISACNTVPPVTVSVPDKLEKISVQVQVVAGRGSGVAFTRKDWTVTNNITFIWTAGHLFDRTNNEMSFFFFDLLGVTNTSIIQNAQIGQNVYSNYDIVSKTNLWAKLITIDVEEDLALLQTDEPFFNTNTTVFDLSGKPLPIGTPLYSVSGPFGLVGTFSAGVVSLTGISDENDKTFDQTSCVVYPGSSGGGVFTTNGVYVGMLATMCAPSINHMIPMRRIQQWAKKEKLEWALDPKVPMPSEKDFKNITPKVGNVFVKPPSFKLNLDLKSSP